MVGGAFGLNSFVLFNILLEAGIIGDKTRHSSHTNLIQSTELHRSICQHHKILPAQLPDPQESPTEEQILRKNPNTSLLPLLNKQINKITAKATSGAAKIKEKGIFRRSLSQNKGTEGTALKL